MEREPTHIGHPAQSKTSSEPVLMIETVYNASLALINLVFVYNQRLYREFCPVSRMLEGTFSYSASDSSSLITYLDCLFSPLEWELRGDNLLYVDLTRRDKANSLCREESEKATSAELCIGTPFALTGPGVSISKEELERDFVGGEMHER